MRRNAYPKELLPNVTYAALENNSFLSDGIVDLEVETMRHCCDLVEAIKAILLQERMIQTPILFMAHLCAYLGIYAYPP